MDVQEAASSPYTLHPTPFSSPQPSHPTPYTPHPTPHTPHPTGDLGDLTARSPEGCGKRRGGVYVGLDRCAGGGAARVQGLVTCLSLSPLSIASLSRSLALSPRLTEGCGKRKGRGWGGLYEGPDRSGGCAGGGWQGAATSPTPPDLCLFCGWSQIHNARPPFALEPSGVVSEGPETKGLAGSPTPPAPYLFSPCIQLPLKRPRTTVPESIIQFLSRNLAKNHLPPRQPLACFVCGVRFTTLWLL